HAAHRNNEDDQYRGTNQQRDGAARKEIRQHIQLVGLHVAANQARRQVTQRTGAEPQPHHLAAHSLRRKQRHGRQANRAQAQFAERQHQDAAHQPERRYARSTAAQHVLCRQHHQAKARCGTQDTDNKLGDAARTNVHARQLRPRPAEHRCQQDDEQGVD
ncbi:hypothetical protein COLO4_01327, partial [Corchorus olitorius]